MRMPSSLKSMRGAYHSSEVVQTHLAVALGSSPQRSRTFTNRKRCTGCVDHLADLLARRHGDLLDGRAVSAEHDLLLAVAHHIDGLLDAHAAVSELLPGLGLDRQAVGKLVMQPAGTASLA